MLVLVHDLKYAVNNLFYKEGLALYLVYALNPHLRVFALQIIGKLAGVKLGHHHFLEAAKHLAGVGRQRVDVTEMSERYLLALAAKFGSGSAQMAVSAAPAREQDVGILIAEHLQLWYVIGYAGNLLATGINHPLMVDSIGADSPRVIIFSRPPKRCAAPSVPGMAQ